MSTNARPRDLVGRAALSVSVACAALVIGTVGVLASPSLRAYFNPPPVPAYAVGERIDVPPSLFDSAPRTVVVFARSTCTGCQRAEPTLASVVSAVRANADTRVVLASVVPDTQAERQFARDMGLAEGQIAPVDPKGLRLRTVPTVVVVNREGTVLYAWEPSRPLEQLATLGGLLISPQ